MKPLKTHEVLRDVVVSNWQTGSASAGWTAGGAPWAIEGDCYDASAGTPDEAQFSFGLQDLHRRAMTLLDVTLEHGFLKRGY